MKRYVQFGGRLLRRGCWIISCFSVFSRLFLPSLIAITNPTVVIKTFPERTFLSIRWWHSFVEKKKKGKPVTYSAGHLGQVAGQPCPEGPASLTHLFPPPLSFLCLFISSISSAQKQANEITAYSLYMCFHAMVLSHLFSLLPSPHLTSSHLCWHLWNTPLMTIFTYIDRHIILKYIWRI